MAITMEYCTSCQYVSRIETSTGLCEDCYNETEKDN